MSYKIKVSGIYQPDEIESIDEALSQADALADAGNLVRVVDSETERTVEMFTPPSNEAADIPTYDPFDAEIEERELIGALTETGFAIEDEENWRYD